MRKTIIISEEQESFLKKNKGLLFEYYEQVSNPRKDTHILGDLQVWIYGDDRNDFTPHCHVMTIDKSVEFEISLIDWRIINVKRGNPNGDMRKRFVEWLASDSTKFFGIKNKNVLFAVWDGNNPNNNLLDFVEKHKIDVQDGDLKKYIDSQRKDT